MNKSKLLILKNELSSYNVSVYNRIAEEYDLTVGFFSDKSKENCYFKKMLFDIKRIGPFVFVQRLFRIVRGYDLVCFVPDLHIISYCMLPFLPRKFKLLNWSIGFRVSYVHPYLTGRKHVFLDWVFQRVLSRCDASIFYMERAKDFWQNTSLNLNRVFVAPNTTSVVPIGFDEKRKKNFLFVGTLYKGKGLNLLLKAYKEAIDIAQIDNELHIVGDGEEYQNIIAFVKDNQLEGKVVLHGAIFDEIELAKHFADALLCISPTQGGLSVPKSMGYGVPFVTKSSAITGGEIFHITPGDNGILYDEDKELSGILVDACRNPKKYLAMGRKAKQYYDDNATIDHMAKGAIAAFDFALNH